MKLKANILWKGLDNNSLENCILTHTNSGFEAGSVIIGISDDKIFRLQYIIKLNHKWETMYVEIKSLVEDNVNTLVFKNDGENNWTMNGINSEQFKGCTEPDISLTPFTNSLPINRLEFADHKQKEIKVIYFDVLEQQIKPKKQRYTKLTDTEYKFENVPNDFEAVIKVDASGLVTGYPGLFTRIAKQQF